jgi:hypothetical protein
MPPVATTSLAREAFTASTRSKAYTARRAQAHKIVGAIGKARKDDVTALALRRARQQAARFFTPPPPPPPAPAASPRPPPAAEAEAERVPTTAKNVSN